MFNNKFIEFYDGGNSIKLSQFDQETSNFKMFWIVIEKGKPITLSSYIKDFMST